MNFSTLRFPDHWAFRKPNCGTAFWLCTLLTLITLAVPALSQVNGAIYTTIADGTTVNGNIYSAKTDVYLTGGPQNQHDSGLSPDGVYYYQVTDPSGAVLLSTDNIACRQVVVSGGRIVGVPAGTPPAACTTGYHSLGTLNGSNGNTPVQLSPYNDTPNPGGEYKAWVTPVQNYSPDSGNLQCSSKKSNVVYGFCDSDSKTDNFKVKAPTTAYVSVCKFNDLNGDGIQTSDEPLIPHWPITATGVDGGTISTQTDDQGCVSFAYSGFTGGQTTQAVTLTEGSLPGWQQTAPADGSQGAFTIAGGAISFNLQPGDNLQAPNFGNICLSDGCGGTGLIVTKDANPSLTRTFTWGITKSVDQAQINTSGGATANYTVTLTHDAGTDSGWEVMGNIRLSNPTPVAITGINVTDAVDNGGSCRITGGGPNGDGTAVTLPSGDHLDLPYICNYTSLPPVGTNTATASWDQTSSTGTATVDFQYAMINAVDGTVNVTDSLGGSLGTVTYTDPTPKTFTYPLTFNDPAGTCTTHPNTATYTSTTNSSTTGSASQSVRVCVGENPVVTKTALGSYTSSIMKHVCKNRFEGMGASFTPQYNVIVTESNWAVSGNITVSNPNDWEDIAVNLSDLLSTSGASCTITGGASQLVPRGSGISPAYSCVFATTPSSASGINTATATWDSAASYTPANSAAGQANFSFAALTVTDTFDGTTSTLGTVPGNAASTTFSYTRTLTNATGGMCRAYVNTATILGTEPVLQPDGECLQHQHGRTDHRLLAEQEWPGDHHRWFFYRRHLQLGHLAAAAGAVPGLVCLGKLQRRRQLCHDCHQGSQRRRQHDERAA